MVGIAIFTFIAFVISIVLVFTNHFFNKVDKRVEDVTSLLPGYNCGACGFGGCAAMAYNVVKNHANPKRCKPIKPEQYQALEEYLKEHNIQ